MWFGVIAHVWEVRCPSSRPSVDGVSECGPPAAAVVGVVDDERVESGCDGSARMSVSVPRARWCQTGRRRGDGEGTETAEGCRVGKRRYPPPLSAAGALGIDTGRSDPNHPIPGEVG